MRSIVNALCTRQISVTHTVPLLLNLLFVETYTYVSWIASLDILYRFCPEQLPMATTSAYKLAAWPKDSAALAVDVVADVVCVYL